MARREFLALGKVLRPDKDEIGGHYMSEKLDGIRVFWDGGLTRDVPTTQVPWAGVLNPKTGQMKTKVRPVSTGLWSRYGNPIIAPNWFLNQLPCIPLDGELFAGRGKFQKTVSYVKKDTPVDEEWENIKFAVFSCPNLWDVMRDGEIKNPQMVCDIDLNKIRRFVNDLPHNEEFVHLQCQGGLTFASELANLNHWMDPTSNVAYMVPQMMLPSDNDEAYSVAMSRAKEVMLEGGEGVILRHPDAIWTPKRTSAILKMKQCLDDEGTLVGFTSGRKTNKGSKLLGKIGALILDYKGQRLELSGLTEAEREFSTDIATEYAINHPGEDMREGTMAKHFKLGQSISFLYRELSDSLIPKEARFLRVRNDLDV